MQTVGNFLCVAEGCGLGCWVNGGTRKQGHGISQQVSIWPPYDLEQRTQSHSSLSIMASIQTLDLAWYNRESKQTI
jgi:hypothetical protein